MKIRKVESREWADVLADWKCNTRDTKPERERITVQIGDSYKKYFCGDFKGVVTVTPENKDIIEDVLNDPDNDMWEYEKTIRRYSPRRVRRESVFSDYLSGNARSTKDIEDSCISMIDSIIAYYPLHKDTTAEDIREYEKQRYKDYLLKYDNLLGRDRVLKLIQYRLDMIDHIEKNVFTDMDGVRYNSIVWK